MKHYRLLLAVFLLLLLSMTCGAAEQYIVYPRTENPELLAAPDGCPSYLVVDGDTLQDMQAADAVLWYEEDVELFLFDYSGYSDPYYAQKWDLTVIDAQSAWQAGYFGDGITIGVIDSGAQADHPDLVANLLPGVSYLDDTDASVDTVGHGTFVAGMAAAAANGIGTVGVAPSVKIRPLKCFESGVKTTVSMLVPAIYDAVDEYGCQIINLSLGSEADSQTLHNAIDYALGKGCIVVAAVGNDGTAALNYPAAYAGVIGVGSIDSKKQISAFSQKNESVTLVAPGEQVISTYIGSKYGKWEGTSFATPLVSGAAALLLCADPTLTPDDVYSLLTRTAEKLGTDAYSTSYGYGLLDIGRAMRALVKTPGDLNRDGEVTLHDALLLLQAVLDGDDTQDAALADLNGDSTISLADVLLLLRTVSA